MASLDLEAAWADIEDNFETAGTKKNGRRELRPLPHQIVVSEDTYVNTKPRSCIPRVAKPRSAMMIDGQ